MRNAYVYFSILLGLALFLIAVFAIVFFRERVAHVLKRRPARKAVPREDFYCVRSSLKQINENFHVAQILFTNRKDCTLTAQGEVRRRASED
ncbi:MAG: hypothetical protein L0387_40925 [Acidobacteria bacterium]|nr:hypothetical protein [Acidobacteriota bacterium]MCI0627952.1 hypothetical protein [Acidobacteriota bacterium]MCI0717446.1 hypothetical protein [Acidobacteriota bacterium]